jgi:N-acyl-D-aspartate/D-glutamate deacylase
MSPDLVIRGGTVVDGSGSPGYEADVAILGSRICEVGPHLRGRREVDAAGRVVCPGFIDIHTHYDAQVFWDPALTPSCFHGVTTVVAGNCGFSIAPTRPEHRDTIARTLEGVEDMDFATLGAGIPWDFETFDEYLDSVERRGTLLNFTAYIGHTALRLFVMGDAAYERSATADEIDAMSRLVEAAIQKGAPGFATSFARTHVGEAGRPIPSRFANREEIEQLCRAVARTGRGVCHFVFGEGFTIEDLYDLQPRIGRPFTFGGLLALPDGRHEGQLVLHRERRARGANVWPQVTPRPLTFQMTLDDPFPLNVAPCMAALKAGAREERIAAYRDPAFRQKLQDELASTPVMKPRWSTYEIAESRREDLVGRRLQEIADQRGASPLDAMLDIALGEDLRTRFRSLIANDDPEQVARLLTLEGVTLGLSDAGAHVGQLCDAPQATDLLGNWVRERRVMPLEAAIRLLSGLQADLFGFARRGYLYEGYAADIVILDPATIAPGPTRRVRDFPAEAERLTADQPSGIEAVIVGGTTVVERGRLVESALATPPGVRPALA